MAIAGAEDEKSFEQMWLDAQNRFEEKTGQALLRSENQSLDQVLIELDKHFNARDSENGSKNKRIKESASNVLKLIELLCGIAAQGASAVFGPATLCFNAMHALISIPAKISKFHDNIALLFSEISAFMKQFKIYRRIEQFAEIDVELKQCTHKVMIVFVDICAISIGIISGSKWTKITSLGKLALFDNDSGVQNKLDELKRLVIQQGQISDAITLEHVLRSEQELTGSIRIVLQTLKQDSESSGKLLEEKSQKIIEGIAATRFDLRTLQKDAEDRKGERKQQDLFVQACKKLLIDQESIRKLGGTFDQMRDDCLPYTGDWLGDIEEYKSWSDLESEVDTPLLLSGSNGSGKSHLAVAALDDLKRRYSSAGSSAFRLSVAYYQFTSDTKMSHTGAVKEALRTMAAQIAEKNLVFSKNLCSRLDSKEPSFMKNTEIERLSTELIAPTSMNDTSDIAYVLFFDGVELFSSDSSNEAENQLYRAILALKSSKIRIMLTKAEEDPSLYLEPSKGSLDMVAKIRVEKHNEADIKRFIDKEVEDCEVLRGDASGITRIVNSIREELPEIVNGNFNKVRQMLDSIEEAVKSGSPEDDVMKLISVDTLKNKPAETDKLIRKLQGSLSVREIEELNEILIWTLYANEYISVDKMRAALVLRTKRTPLQSLQDKVTQKYSKLLYVNPGNFFQMKNSYLEEYFADSKRQEHIVDAEGTRDPKISMTIKIDGVKLSKVQRFLWDLSEKVVLDKFMFTESLADSGHNTPISANRTEGHLTITRRCYEVLANEPNENTKAIARYALVNFPNHLWSLRTDVDDGHLNQVEREEIVEYLVYLLRSPDCIEEHLIDEFFWRQCWINDDDLSLIGKWLRDTNAWGRLRRKEMAWVKHVVASEEFLALALKDVAAMIARHWLCYRTWSAELPYQWLDAFLDRWASGTGQNQTVEGAYSASDIKDSDGKTETMAPQEDLQQGEMLVSTRIVRAAEWAENVVKIPKNSLWFERLGNTYLYCDETELSIKAFLSAKELPNCSWEVSEGLATAYAAKKDLVLALQEMEVVLAELRGKQERTTTERDGLVKCLNKAARWQLGNHTDAIEKLQEAMRLDEYEFQSHCSILKIFMQVGMESEALKLLIELRTRSGRDGSATQLEAMLTEFSTWEDPLDSFEIVFHAARQKDIFQTTLDIIERAIRSARETEAILVSLLLCQGVALAGYSSEEEHRESALARWTESYSVGLKSGDYFAQLAAKYVFKYHFSKVRSEETATHEKEVHVEKVKAMAESANNSYLAPWLRLMLASLYRLLGKDDAAQKLLLNDMKTGFDLLSDNDPENDYLGYEKIARILMHTGDDLNALSAWSLYGPEERRREYLTQDTQNGKEADSQSIVSPPSVSGREVHWSCDARCGGGGMSWEDSFWMCKVCDYFDLHVECFEKLRTGTLPFFTSCSPDHEWLLVPSWTDEYRATGRGRVRMGGELVDGKRVGGQIIPVKEWLDMVREKWGIDKPSLAVQTDNEKPDQ